MPGFESDQFQSEQFFEGPFFKVMDLEVTHFRSDLFYFSVLNKKFNLGAYEDNVFGTLSQNRDFIINWVTNHLSTSGMLQEIIRKTNYQTDEPRSIIKIYSQVKITMNLF